MITKLKLAQMVRELIASGVVTALCEASRRARRALSPEWTCDAQCIEGWFDEQVRNLAAQFEGNPDDCYIWHNDVHGRTMRLAVCDHIINELEQA